MNTKIWYSIENGGDGSAYPIWMESEDLAILDQKWMDEGWGEPCYGCIEIESEAPITIRDDIVTIDEKIKEIEEELNEDYMKEYKEKGEFPETFIRLEGYLADLKALR